MNLSEFTLTTPELIVKSQELNLRQLKIKHIYLTRYNQLPYTYTFDLYTDINFSNTLTALFLLHYF